MTEKVCILHNARFSWVLKVDNQNVLFQGSYNADYFEEHYKQLGYKIVRTREDDDNDKTS